MGRRRQPRRLRRPASGVPLGGEVGGEEGGREGCRRQRPSLFAQTAAPVLAAAKGELVSPDTLAGPGRRARTQTQKPSCIAMLSKDCAKQCIQVRASAAKGLSAD